MTDYGIRKYRIGRPRLSRSLLKGFWLEGDALRTCGKGEHSVFLPGLDSAQVDCPWGRISLRCALGPESMLTIRAFAANQNTFFREGKLVKVDEVLLSDAVPREEKERLFLLADGAERSGVQDLLLPEQNGRYLWLWLEVSGEGETTLDGLRVYTPGDHFMRTFPQIYQTDNDFLQRYLSVFSTMYQEFQEQIDVLPELLDVDTAPEQMLPILASWLGLEIDQSLFTSEELRKILKAAPKLMRWKGSKGAIEQIVGLFVPQQAYIVERNLLQNQVSGAIYGETPYDFTVMVNCKMEHQLRLQLQFLVDQFKPIRSRCRIVFLEECNSLDSYTYLDINSTVLQNTTGSLDDGVALAGITYLE